MKHLITASLLLLSTTIFSQKKDTIQYLPDSVNTISISDIQKLMAMVEDKITKKEGDAWTRAFQNLIAITEEKRIKKQPKK